MRIGNWMIVFAAGAMAFLFTASAGYAQSEKSSPCKGLEQAACTAKADCSWVAATKRKDGREVKAYCRLKSNKSAAATITSEK